MTAIALGTLAPQFENRPAKASLWTPRRPIAGRGAIVGALAAALLWGAGALAVMAVMKPATPSGDDAPARLALTLPVTPLSLNRPPVRPGRFERTPEIPDIARPGLSAGAVAAAHRRYDEAERAAALNAALGQAAAKAVAALADYGPRTLAFVAGTLAPAEETAAPTRLAAATEPEPPVLPPLPADKPAPPKKPRIAVASVEPPPVTRPPAVRPPVALKPPAPQAGPALAMSVRHPGVAVYDISAGLVYMPDGSRLEAHSGIGSMRDNPRFVHVRMRGATPPATYRLSLRESLFHGVRAIRLTPVDGNNPHGRVGLLAHTYMLRVPGDSNGCVVFRQYDRFLQAFLHGDIRQMVVVASVASGRGQELASLESANR